MHIRKLLTIGLFASILTGIGDFLLGYAENAAGVSVATSVMAGAPNLADWQMIAGGLLATLPSAEQFKAFENSLRQSSEE